MCESWVHDMSGNKEHLVSLNPRLFGLPPRPQVLVPIVLRQLKLKLQDEPYGSEENNFVSTVDFRIFLNGFKLMDTSIWDFFHSLS